MSSRRMSRMFMDDLVSEDVVLDLAAPLRELAGRGQPVVESWVFTAPAWSGALDLGFVAVPPSADLPFAGETSGYAEVTEVNLLDGIHVHLDDLAALGTSASLKSGGGGGTGSATGVLSSYTSGVVGAYNINIVFKGTWTTDLQGAFISSADRISKMIIGDLPNVSVKGRVIDDLQITAELRAIDGDGGILGQAGPTAVRTSSYLPCTAIMQFDSADAKTFLGYGLWDEIVTHEMLHSVGVGSIWANKGLVTNFAYTGANAVAQYDSYVDAFAAANGGSTTLANGITLTKGAVPVETEGGAGTAGVHWAETVFDTELMTGIIDWVDPLSSLTAASLADLGYVTPALASLDSPVVDPYALA